MSARNIIAKEVTPLLYPLMGESCEPDENCFNAADNIIDALKASGLHIMSAEPTTDVLSAIADAYLSGATDRLAGNPQRAVPAARQAWREIVTVDADATHENPQGQPS